MTITTTLTALGPGSALHARKPVDASFSRLMRALVAVLMLALVGALTGCAAERMNREGLALIDEGHYEEGLQKLQQAAKEEPDNVSYRIALRRSREQAIERLVGAASEARAADRRDLARQEYQLILRIDPENRRATEGLEQLARDERHQKMIATAQAELKKGNLDAAKTLLKPVLLEDESNSEALALKRKINDRLAEQQLAGPSLKAQFRKPVTLQFRDADVRMVFEALSRVSGINVLLDRDVRPDLKVSIFVKDVSVEDTIDLILMQSQLQKKIISDNTIFVYPDTPMKVKEYQDLVIRSFHLTNADPKQMMTMLKTVLKTKDIFLNEKINTIVIRDTPEAIRVAEKMIADQDIADPEVMMEVEVLEVNRTRLTDLGIKWPDQLTLTAVGSGALSGAATAAAAATNPLLPTLDELKRINATNIVTSPQLSVALHAMMQDSNTHILASPRIRARNREKAKIMIGDRVPVITNAVTPVSTGSPVVTGSVQYLDVGLKLEVEPDIHLDNEVAIKINLDVSSIVKEVQNTTSGTLAYQIGTRNASTLLQLKDGETQILAGLIDNEQRNAANKVPGLGQLPILGRLFSEHNDNGTRTEVILSITPHIIGKLRHPDATDAQFWSGTADNVSAKPLLLKAINVPGGSSNAGSLAASAQAQNVLQAGVPSQPLSGASLVAMPATPLALSWQGPTQTKVGNKISFTLNTQSSQPVKSLGFVVDFDPKVMKPIDVVEGSFFAQGNAPSKLTKVIDEAGGKVKVDLSSAAPGGVSGTGSLAAILFEATQPSNSTPISATQILPVGPGDQPIQFNAPQPLAIMVGQ